MMGLGVTEVLLFTVVSTLLTLTVAYYVIRFAVRDGLVDAQRRIDSARVRDELGLGAERSPNSRR
jgi:hypothetical protein